MEENKNKQGNPHFGHMNDSEIPVNFMTANSLVEEFLEKSSEESLDPETTQE